MGVDSVFDGWHAGAAHRQGMDVVTAIAERSRVDLLRLLTAASGRVDRTGARVQRARRGECARMCDEMVIEITGADAHRTVIQGTAEGGHRIHRWPPDQFSG